LTKKKIKKYQVLTNGFSSASLCKRRLFFLIIVAALIGIGIILSFFGSQLITEGLTVGEQNIMPGNSLQVLAELDPSISQNGVYVVQTKNFREGEIIVKILEPMGGEIISKTIDKNSFEDRFEISSFGTYKLFIENLGQEETQVIGVIGHLPDKSKLSLGITGLYVLTAGLVGVVAVGIYAIKNRRKNKFN